MRTYLTFNHSYVLKPDDGRALIMSAIVGRDSYLYMGDTSSTYIHPIFAMILSFFDGRDYQSCVDDASRYLHVKSEEVGSFIRKLINNSNFVSVKSKYGNSFFPPYTIVPLAKEDHDTRYNAEMFAYSSVDLRFKRHLTPSTITLMVNNICATDCIYCYQDKSRRLDCQIPLERIKELIQEARAINVRTFDVIGGEFFLYPYWEEVLGELKKQGYDPYLSTKIPIDETVIKKLKSLGIRDLQISLDTFIIKNLIVSLKTNRNYTAQMKRTLELLDRYGIPIMVHTVLSRFNHSANDMESVYSQIAGLHNVMEWKVVTADDSIHAHTSYDNFKIDMEGLNEIECYFNKIKQDSPIKIITPWIHQKESVNTTEELFFNRNFCSGNYSSLYILPTGDVTICEQLYWNETFLLGNVNHQSISDIWNSKKAKSLFYINQKEIPDDSLCSSCLKFDSCRSIKQVCYRDIIKKYGPEKWYYPDVNCPYVRGVNKI